MMTMVMTTTTKAASQMIWRANKQANKRSSSSPSPGMSARTRTHVETSHALVKHQSSAGG